MQNGQAVSIRLPERHNNLLYLKHYARNEVKTIQMTQVLDFDDCKRLFPEIRLAKTNEARTIVQAYLNCKWKESRGPKPEKAFPEDSLVDHAVT